jgi:nucleoside-diphosphate-sugar epimerase
MVHTEANRHITVVVTGCNGYIGSNLTKSLCELGFNVRGTVRSLKELRKIKHMRSLCTRNPPILYTADLNTKGSFEQAFTGADYVVHTASPFFNHRRVKSAEKELIEPAVNGTIDIMEEAHKAGVKRLVLTSSGQAIMDASNPPTDGKIYSEQDWNENTLPCYTRSKVLAERAAWDFSKSHVDKPELVSILPGFCIGPPVSGRTDSESINIISNLLNGRMKYGSPPICIGYVDVRDVVNAHIEAMLRPAAKNNRYLCQLTSQYTFLELSNLLREETDYFQHFSLPTKYLAYTKPPVPSKRYHVNITKTEKELGITLRPAIDSLIDMANALVEYGIVKPPPSNRPKSRL